MRFKQPKHNIIALLSIFTMLLWSACTSDNSKDAEIPTGDAYVEEDMAFEVTGLPSSMQIPFFLNTDRTGQDTSFMLENPYFDPKFLTLDTLVKALNMNNPDIHMEFVKRNEDTIFVKIEDATYLTQQMGTEGALAYMAEVVYGFTILPNVNVVNFDFKEGDHAIPGNYTRDSFDNF